MKQINGWHLPSRDGYFTKFAEGAPRKANGFQKEHLGLAFKHVREWDIAIDVGAHVGFWTVDMAARFEQVFAFEPAPDTYECLVKNTAEFPNVLAAQAAVGDKQRASVSIREDPNRPGNTGARFIDVGTEGAVSMVALDDLGFDGCDLLKIDVEGYEIEVLKGARALIKAYRPVVIMETDKRFPGRYRHGVHASRLRMLELDYREVEYRTPDARRPGLMRNAIHPDRIFVPNV